MMYNHIQVDLLQHFKVAYIFIYLLLSDNTYFHLKVYYAGFCYRLIQK